jgi:hypothetical protein
MCPVRALFERYLAGTYRVTPLRNGGGVPGAFARNGGGVPGAFARNGGGVPGAFAIMTAPSVRAATTVFKPIAAVNTNIAASSALRLDDMCASKAGATPETLYTC